ncbi:MAG: hypothetical protein ACI4JS_11600 [Oscillospiraceae bacterium]
MSKFKELFLKCLPMLIVLVSTGLFMFAIKLVIGIFYEPKDTVYEKTYGEEKFVVVQCYQTPSSMFYVYEGDFSFDESKLTNKATEHNKIHMNDKPRALFTLNEPAPDMEDTVVKTLFTSNGLDVLQFGEFVIYKLEGEYGVFAPLREYKESATKRKNDLYVVRQMLKNDRWKAFDLPTWESSEDFLKQLEKIEWHLDAEHAEDI